MRNGHFEVDPIKPFSESLIWDINIDYYKKMGIEAWRSGVVPHNMTSNAVAGKTYAELILGFLRDLANQGATKETVYILELGAGHGRLAFHTLKHLQRLEKMLNLELPPYCYVVSDIVEDNLAFFQNHPQFQTYLKQGVLDVSYFDAIKSKEIHLRYQDTTIDSDQLKQPIIVLANYFFDSIPTDLFLIKDQIISSCGVGLSTALDPAEMDEETLLKNLKFTYQKDPVLDSFYKKTVFNEILESYRNLFLDTHLFFPKRGFLCLENIERLSQKGMMLLSMDKGFHEIHDLQDNGEPEFVTHGSCSLWVNYHAYGAFCKKKGGTVLFPSFSTFYLDIACLLFLPEGKKYIETNAAYQRFVNDFGPDDFNGLKRLAYKHVSKLTFMELISFIRLSYYDSSIFINLLPHLKRVSKKITVNERKRLGETLREVWNMYFTINEPFDLAYEIGGLLYDIGFYKEAVIYFTQSIELFGEKEDLYYNKILCYYQLREDQLFAKTLKEAKFAFPNYERFKELEKLDLNAA